MLCRGTMSEERFTLAVERFERAIARAEKAGRALEDIAGAEVSARESLQTELDRLDARHRRLRASAASAIEQLDSLITPQNAMEPNDG